MPNNSDNQGGDGGINEPTLNFSLDDFDLNLDTSDVDPDSDLEEKIETTFQESTIVVDQGILESLGKELKEEDEEGSSISPDQEEYRLYIESIDNDLKLDKKFIALPNNKKIKVGREEGDFLVPHRSISNLHATFFNNNEVISVTDNKSTNGVFINGERIPSRRMVFIEENDVIGIGQVQFRLKFPGEPLIIEDIESKETHNSSHGGFDLDLGDIATPEIPAINENSAAQVETDDLGDDDATKILSHSNLMEELPSEVNNSEEGPSSLDFSNPLKTEIDLEPPPLEIDSEVESGGHDEDATVVLESPLSLDNETSQEEHHGLFEEEDRIAAPVDLPIELTEVAEVPTLEEEVGPTELSEEVEMVEEDFSTDLTMETSEISIGKREPEIKDEDETKEFRVEEKLKGFTENELVDEASEKRKELVKNSRLASKNSKNQKPKIQMKKIPADFLSRFIAFIGEMGLAILFYSFVSNNQVFQLIETDILELVSPIISLSPISIPGDFFVFYFLFVVLRILSSVIFGQSIFQTLMGMKVQGSFLSIRLKGILREVLGLFLGPLLVFDLPLLMGKKSIKELASGTVIEVGPIAQRILVSLFIVPSIMVPVLFMDFIKDWENRDGLIVNEVKFRESKNETGTLGISSFSSEHFKFKGFPIISESQVGVVGYDIVAIGKKSLLIPHYSYYDMKYKNHLKLKIKKASFLKEILRIANKKESQVSRDYPLINQYLSDNKSENINLLLQDEISLFIKKSLSFNLESLVSGLQEFKYDIAAYIEARKFILDSLGLDSSAEFEILEYRKQKFLRIKSNSNKKSFDQSVIREYLLSLGELNTPIYEVEYFKMAKDKVFMIQFLKRNFMKANFKNVTREDEIDDSEYALNLSTVIDYLHKNSFNNQKLESLISWYEDYLRNIIIDFIKKRRKNEGLHKFLTSELKSINQMIKIMSKKGNQESRLLFESSNLGLFYENFKSKNYSFFMIEESSIDG